RLVAKHVAQDFGYAIRLEAIWQWNHLDLCRRPRPGHDLGMLVDGAENDKLVVADGRGLEVLAEDFLKGLGKSSRIAAGDLMRLENARLVRRRSRGGCRLLCLSQVAGQSENQARHEKLLLHGISCASVEAVIKVKGERFR